VTDEELAAAIFPDDPGLGVELVKAVTPELRATWERLVEVADKLNSGVRHIPGVIVCKRGKQ
jgi:hypothetical protein